MLIGGLMRDKIFSNLWSKYSITSLPFVLCYQVARISITAKNYMHSCRVYIFYGCKRQLVSTIEKLPIQSYLKSRNMSLARIIIIISKIPFVIACIMLHFVWNLSRLCCIDWEKSIEVKLLKIFFSSENEPQDFKLRSLLSCSVLFEICQAADFLQFAESTFSFDDNFKPISTNIYERIVYVRHSQTTGPGQ